MEKETMKDKSYQEYLKRESVVLDFLKEFYGEDLDTDLYISVVQSFIHKDPLIDVYFAPDFFGDEDASEYQFTMVYEEGEDLSCFSEISIRNEDPDIIDDAETLDDEDLECGDFSYRSYLKLTKDDDKFNSLSFGLMINDDEDLDELKYLLRNSLAEVKTCNGIVSAGQMLDKIEAAREACLEE